MRGRLDALLLATAIAPHTSSIGLVPTITTTHTEPFHVATGVQTLDYVSEGRAGWRVQVSGRAHEAAHVGRRTLPALDPALVVLGTDPAQTALIEDLFGEARDAVEVARRLWDSWEDDAVIRDVETGRFVDREKLHYIDFVGDRFTVEGPSITPRPPQGQPLVYALAHQKVPYELAVAGADIVGVTPHDDAHLEAILGQLETAAHDVVRGVDEPLRVWTEISVLIEKTVDAAHATLDRLNATHGEPWTSDTVILADTPEAVAAQAPALALPRYRRCPAAAGAAAGGPHGDHRARCSAAACRRGARPSGRSRDPSRPTRIRSPREPLRDPCRHRPRRRLHPRARPDRKHPLMTTTASTTAHPIAQDASGRPLRQVHLAAHFPGVNNTSVWSDGKAESQIAFSSFRHFAQNAERGKFDFLFLAEGLRLREQKGLIHDLDVVGRPNTLAILAGIAAVTEHIGLVGTLRLDVQRTVRTRQAAREPRPAE
ncbi:LLM class flavin-dependent oxidoreductase [Cryobacterium breve]|uniref:LLM class flavin-dependent oxidoreductase n=1 Tax=Cryobacterium breve TaxID=1259258 RepID=UPI0032B2C934